MRATTKNIVKEISTELGVSQEELLDIIVEFFVSSDHGYVELKAAKESYDSLLSTHPTLTRLVNSTNS